MSLSLDFGVVMALAKKKVDVIHLLLDYIFK